MWHPTQATVATLAVGICVLALGVLTGRGGIALLGVPLVLSVLIGGDGRPVAATRATRDGTENHDGAGRVCDRVRLESDAAADVVHVRVSAAGYRAVEVVVPGGGTRDLTVRLGTRRTGPQLAFDLVARARSIADVAAEDVAALHVPERLVLPTATPLGRVPVATRLRGLTGPRTTRRLGDGTELRDIHPMAPGDSWRRVDWRATARVSPALDAVQVRRTLATGDATAVLVLDSRDEVGPDLHTWRGSGPLRVDEPTSLDLARNAAASVAKALLPAGDRVGLEDLAHRRRPLPPSTGQRHLRRILHGLALASPVGEPTRTVTLSSGATAVRPPRVPADAIVYLFTTLLDDVPAQLVGQWQERSIPVVVIDTLPTVRPVPQAHLHLAWQIMSMERADRIRGLEAAGVPVIAWTGTGSRSPAHRFEVMSRATTHQAPTPGGRR